MSRNWTLLPLILFLGSAGTLQAQPLDSPDTVYIDGQPCSRACQAYMNWSYRAQSARHREEREIVAVPAGPEFEQVQPVARPRAAKHAAPVARAASQAGKTASNGYASGAKAPNGKKIAAPNAAPPAALQAMPPAVAAATPPKPAEETTAAIPKPEPKVERANPPAQTVAVAPSRPAAAPAPKELASKEPAPKPSAPEVKTEAKAEVAVEKKPEIVLPPPATLEVAAAPAAPAPATAPSKAREIAKAASSASLDDPDNLVALVLVRPEITSLSDLNNRNIAITEKQSASSGRVSAALMAAGAAEVRFSEVKSSAIDRLMNGEVPAAVVLAPRDIANLFPEVEGFRTFRVPLKAKM
jgi:hypothetical protein